MANFSVSDQTDRGDAGDAIPGSTLLPETMGIMCKSRAELSLVRVNGVVGLAELEQPLHRIIYKFRYKEDNTFCCLSSSSSPFLPGRVHDKNHNEEIQPKK